MASLEIGSQSKSIQYISITKESTGGEDFCNTDDRWSNPILNRQSDYLVALSRFEIPLNRVPITKKMDGCIQIYKYNDTLTGEQHNIQNHLGFTKNVEYLGKSAAQVQAEDRVTRQVGIDFLDACEEKDVDQFHMTPNGDDDARTIDMPACYSVYEFVKKLNAQIKEALIMNKGARMIEPKVYKGVDALDQVGNYIHRSAVVAQRNLFGAADGTCLNKEEPIAQFEVAVDSDSTFSVKMNHAFAQWYYIKMSPELFDMLQFQEEKTEFFDRTKLPGRRFMGDRFITRVGNAVVHELNQDGSRNLAYFTSMTLADLQKSEPPYSPTRRGVTTFTAMDHVKADGPLTSSLNNIGIQRLEYMTDYVSQYVTTFTAASSAADSINRIKSLVFSSSLATTSESVSGNTYRRVMTDFTVPVQNSFSWKPNMVLGAPIAVGSISENAPSELSYTNPNPSGGRWLALSDPSPLYELKMDINAKCWNFATKSFDYEPIPLPPGSTFTCKLIFISRNELYHETRPDSLHRS